MVSIILVNFNTANLTLQAIDSIFEKYINVFSSEIIVVDNASEPDDFIRLKQGIDKLSKRNIKLISSRFNTGFGLGNMLGVQEATQRYYAFVNNDVILSEDVISEMVRFLEETPNASIAGAQAVNQEGKKAKTFDYGLSLYTEIFSDKFLQKINSKKYFPRFLTSDIPVKVGAVPGSLMVVKACDFDVIGGFDSNLFLYYEEKDLSYRIKKTLNKDTYSLPYLTYIHLEGKSTKPSQTIRNELKISQFYTIKKNLGVKKYYIFYLYSFIRFSIKGFFSSKNRAFLSLLLKGVSPAYSIKHVQKIKKQL